MRLILLLRSFAGGPWPLLFVISVTGALLSLLQVSEDHFTDICSGESNSWRTFTGPQLIGAAASWVTMLLAMMPPLLAMPLIHTWKASLPRRRIRAVLGFAAGYAVTWTLAGPAFIAAAWMLRWIVGDQAGVAAVLLAIAWSASPWHRRALNRSHRLPRIGLFGLAADRDCLAFGLTHGVWCIVSCWAWMLVPLVAGTWHVPVMLVAGGMMLAQRLSAPRRPAWSWPTQLSHLRGN